MAERRVVLIPADDEKPVVSVVTYHDEPDEWLGFCQDYVGGLIDRVTLDRLEGCALYFDDEGRLKGESRNRRATFLAGYFDYALFLPLVGNVLLVGPADEEGETLTVPTHVANPVLRLLR